MLAYWILESHVSLIQNDKICIYFKRKQKESFEIGNVFVEERMRVLVSQIHINSDFNASAQNVWKMFNSVEMEIDFVFRILFIQSAQRHFSWHSLETEFCRSENMRCSGDFHNVIWMATQSFHVTHVHDDIHDETWWLASFMMRCENLLPL